jgi:hypothetical protein
VKIPRPSLFLGSQRSLRAEDPLLREVRGRNGILGAGQSRIRYGSAGYQVAGDEDLPCRIAVRGHRSEPSTTGPGPNIPDPSPFLALQPQIDEASK